MRDKHSRASNAHKATYKQLSNSKPCVLVDSLLEQGILLLTKFLEVRLWEVTLCKVWVRKPLKDAVAARRCHPTFRCHRLHPPMWSEQMA